MIIGSFQTILNQNGEATASINTSIGNVNSALNIIVTSPVTLPVALAGIITVVVYSFLSGGGWGEGRD